MKLYFRYGTMDSSKTARLLMDAHEYKKRGQKVLLLKPVADTRSKSGMIESRVGLSAPCIDISSDFNIIQEVAKSKEPIACIFIDEAQWLTTAQVVQLRIIADNFGIPSMCYGLKSDFLGNLWEGAKALFEHANRVEEVKTICRHKGCKSKAMYNSRFKNGKPAFEGETIQIGDTKTEKDKYYYIPKCSKHFFEDLKEFNATRKVK
jgi:thymidine kinase